MASSLLFTILTNSIGLAYHMNQSKDEDVVVQLSRTDRYLTPSVLLVEWKIYRRCSLIIGTLVSQFCPKSQSESFNCFSLNRKSDGKKLKEQFQFDRFIKVWNTAKIDSFLVSQ